VKRRDPRRTEFQKAPTHSITRENRGLPGSGNTGGTSVAAMNAVEATSAELV
jgi:hypothetical protein